jgi:hypothetical protein
MGDETKFVALSATVRDDKLRLKNEDFGRKIFEN